MQLLGQLLGRFGLLIYVVVMLWLAMMLVANVPPRAAFLLALAPVLSVVGLVASFAFLNWTRKTWSSFNTVMVAFAILAAFAWYQDQGVLLFVGAFWAMVLPLVLLGLGVNFGLQRLRPRFDRAAFAEHFLNIAPAVLGTLMFVLMFFTRDFAKSEDYAFGFMGALLAAYLCIVTPLAFGWYLAEPPLPPPGPAADAKLADPDELKKAGLIDEG